MSQKVPLWCFRDYTRFRPVDGIEYYESEVKTRTGSSFGRHFGQKRYLFYRFLDLLLGAYNVDIGGQELAYGLNIW